MHKMARVLTTLYLMVGLNVTASAKEPVPSSASPGVTAAELSYQNPVHWVSIAQIENSLQGKAPMAVGFDIDDTVLFSSPGFYHGKNTFSPDSRDYLNNPEYWEKMNNGWDQFSLPKKVGNELIAMHLKRGDAIFFITARMATKTETLTKTLQDNFHIPQALMNPIIFAGGAVGQNSKAQWLQEKQIKIYYGDADQDILAARAAGARGIRILRAANSNEQPLPKAGAMGEEVVVNSEY